jgi:4-hydroxysphinganine ceramide fatty acyl 2-hydroxylase
MAARNLPSSGRLFDSPMLEALSRTHIVFPLAIFSGTSIASLWWAASSVHLPLLAWVLLVLAGLLFFTWVEYMVHRYVYHMHTDSPRKTRLQYVFHGVHHDHPRDKQRLALPPWLSVIVAGAFIGVFRLLLGPLGLAFGGGFLLGYATYLAIHYAVHVYPPPKNRLAILWKHHNLHHFASDDSAFGVSSPLWDMVYGTLPVDPR